jgi:hypothetical protein
VPDSEGHRHITSKRAVTFQYRAAHDQYLRKQTLEPRYLSVTLLYSARQFLDFVLKLDLTFLGLQFTNTSACQSAGVVVIVVVPI